MERIWNLQELKSMFEWKENGYGDWRNEETPQYIMPDMIGQTVEWCKKHKYKVTPEMIAEPTDEQERELLMEAVDEVSAKLQELLEKGEISINLDSIIKIFMVDSLICSASNKMNLLNYQVEKHHWTEREAKKYYALYQNNLNKVFVAKTEPTKEPIQELKKPFGGYQKWYVLCKANHTEFIDTVWAKSKMDAFDAFTDVVEVYTEQKAIELGLHV